jgi:hypothetical protein
METKKKPNSPKEKRKAKKKHKWISRSGRK